MKNKKSMEVSPMSLVIVAAILGLVLVVTVYGILPILTKKQIPFIGSQAEATTQDCDEDDIIGLNDKCPCVKYKQEKCGDPEPRATENCPNLCKKR